MSQYDGYQSFQYLDDEAYDQIEVTDSDHAGRPYEVPLSADEDERANRFIDENLIISLHEHTAYLPKDVYQRGEYVRQGRVKVPYHLLSEGPLDAAFFNFMGVRTWDQTIKNLGLRRADIAKQNYVTVVEDGDDLRTLPENGQFGFVLAIETGMPIQNDLDRLDVLYGLGIRSMGLTYSESNALGTGLNDQENDGGLTNFGEEAIGRMNDLGLLIDASHASDRTTIDAARVSDDPIILSHNGARQLNDVARLDPDDVLEAVADTGGVIGIQAAPHNTVSPDSPRHSIESIMDHFEYIVDLVGIDHVTFGPDAFWGNHVELHEYFGKDLSKYPDWVETGVDYVEGAENPNEVWTNVVRWLVKHGYSDEEIQKVTSENVLRVADEVW